MDANVRFQWKVNFPHSSFNYNFESVPHARLRETNLSKDQEILKNQIESTSL